MAKRRSTSTAIVRAIPVRAPAPIIRVAAPRPVPAKKQRHRRRSSSSGGALSGKTMMGAGIGGAVLGFIERSFPTLPTVPLIGRAGTIALGAYLLSRRGGMGGGILRDVALAASAVAGYQLGATGRIAGDDDLIAPQVSGVAAQV